MGVLRQSCHCVKGLLGFSYSVIPAFWERSYVRNGEVAKMQKAIECAWRLHWWVHMDACRKPNAR